MAKTPQVVNNGRPIKRIGDIAKAVLDKQPDETSNPTVEVSLWGPRITIDPTIAKITVPPKGLKGVYIVSPQPLTVPTHWWTGRTLPHLQKNCKACEGGQRIDWKTYFYICGDDMRVLVLLEVPQRSCQPLQAWFSKHRSLRGCRLSATRRGGKAKGPIVLTTLDDTPALAVLPTQHAIWPHLCRMWHMSLPDQVAAESAAFNSVNNTATEARHG